MTIVVGTDFVSFAITSTAIQAFSDAEEGTLTLSVTHNCGTPVETELAVEDLDDANTYTLLPEDTRFADGVYLIQVTHGEVDTVTTDYTLVFVDYELTCSLITYYNNYKACITKSPCADTEQFWPLAFTELLRRVGTCTELTATAACELYAYVLEILAEEYDCGCN